MYSSNPQVGSSLTDVLDLMVALWTLEHGRGQLKPTVSNPVDHGSPLFAPPRRAKETPSQVDCPRDVLESVSGNCSEWRWKAVKPL